MEGRGDSGEMEEVVEGGEEGRGEVQRGEIELVIGRGNLYGSVEMVLERDSTLVAGVGRFPFYDLVSSLVHLASLLTLEVASFDPRHHLCIQETPE